MEVIINLAYIVASIFFIFGIKMLGRAETARQGNRVSSIGMLIAVVATLVDAQVFDSILWIVVGLGIGAAIGYVAAARVEMTGMPELVALFNGFGGLASLGVGWAEYQAQGCWARCVHDISDCSGRAYRWDHLHRKPVRLR